MIENDYYVGGKNDGFHDTPLGSVGTAVCWETIRTQTVRRLAGRIDFLMTGSHWWSTPCNCKHGRRFFTEMDRMNRDYMKAAPGTLAPLVRVADLDGWHC